MFRRNLVIGGLIAGAFLLPTVASAVVTGVCSNCHTMHDSQDGSASVGHTTLLSANCAGCHASATQNDATGRGVALPNAPQVDNTTAGTAGFVNNAGYFDAAFASDTTRHNVSDLADVDGTLGNTPPGGAVLGTQLACISCHSGNGAHHSTSPSNYRILAGTTLIATTQGQTDFGATAKTAALTSGSRAEISYNATAMNSFCGGCHGAFHQGGNMTIAGDQYSGAGGVWIRHPTDIAAAPASGPSIVAYNATADVDAVVVGTAGGSGAPTAASNIVMCLSCHVPHGGPYADLLSFNYAAVTAGANGATVGCETCHSYAGVGM